MGLFSRKKPQRRPERRIRVPEGFELPAKTQWGYTPALLDTSIVGDLSGKILTGTELAPRVSLHHDAAGADMTIRRPDGLQNGLEVAFNSFDGSFCSLAFGLPDHGVRGLGRNHLLRLSLHAQSAAPFKAYARLNLVYGPNSEQITRMIDIGAGDSFAEFDIFYSCFDPQRASDAWIDLIFNDPEGRAVTLSDVVILRRVRASL